MPSTEPDDERLYWIVRHALRDAVWDLVETVLTVVITVLLITVGVGFIARGLSVDAGPVGWLSLAFGGTLVVAAMVYFLREFRLLPFADR